MIRNWFVRPSLLLALALGFVSQGAAPALAEELYFNSYGWDKIYRMDTVTQAVTLIPASDILKTTFFSNADFGRDGKLYGLASNELYHVDVSGSTSVWTKEVKLAENAQCLAFSPLNELYVTNGSTLRKVNRDGTTVPGTTVTVKYFGQDISLATIDFGEDGTLYGGTSDHVYTINRTSGAASLVFALPNLNGGIFTDMDVSLGGMIRVLGSFDYLFDYNPATGDGGWSPDKLLYNGQAFSPSSLASPVPEPAALLLLATGGLAALGLGLRRRWWT